MTHATLVKLGEKWLSRRTAVTFVDFRSYTTEQPDVIGWSSLASTVIECKVSRNDFLRDREKVHRKNPYLGMGAYRYFLTPANLVKPDELLPEGWGLLWATGNQVTEQVAAKLQPEYNRADEIVFLVSMLRRTKLRIGSRTLSEFLRQDQQAIGRSGVPLNAQAAHKRENVDWLLSRESTIPTSKDECTDVCSDTA